MDAFAHTGPLEYDLGVTGTYQESWFAVHGRTLKHSLKQPSKKSEMPDFEWLKFDLSGVTSIDNSDRCIVVHFHNDTSLFRWPRLQLRAPSEFDAKLWVHKLEAARLAARENGHPNIHQRKLSKNIFRRRKTSNVNVLKGPNLVAHRRDSMEARSITQSGYLGKWPSEGLLKQFQQRWFVLDGHYLSYSHENPGKADYKYEAVYELRSVKLLETTEASSLGIFLLHFSEGTPLKLQARSPENAAVWINALESALNSPSS